jgi:hypothetical protein
MCVYQTVWRSFEAAHEGTDGAGSGVGRDQVGSRLTRFALTLLLVYLLYIGIRRIK